MQEVLLSQALIFSADTLRRAGLFFPSGIYPQSPRAPQEARFLSPEVEMEPPPGALRESPGVGALRPEGGLAGEG